MIYCKRIKSTVVVEGVRKFEVELSADAVSEITSAMSVSNLPDGISGGPLTVSKMLNGSTCIVPSASYPIYVLSGGSWVEFTGE